MTKQNSSYIMCRVCDMTEPDYNYHYCTVVQRHLKCLYHISYSWANLFSRKENEIYQNNIIVNEYRLSKLLV
jgi:hypothetical protein